MLKQKIYTVMFLVLVMLCSCSAPPTSDAPTINVTEAPTKTWDTWIKKFEGDNYGAFLDMARTPDGNILVVGATNHLHFPPYSGDLLMMKLTLDGDVLWEKTWGGEGYEQAWSVVPSGMGGYYVFGETDTYGNGNRDFLLLKITEDGSEEWFKTYGGKEREWPFGMIRLANGDLLVFGDRQPDSGGSSEQYAIRLDPEGEVLWEYIGDSPTEDSFIDALETMEGDLVLAVVIGDDDGGMVKLNSGGDVQWNKRYELKGWQFASQIAQTEDGGFLLAGFGMVSGSRQQADIWLARAKPDGELLWEKTFGDQNFDDYAQTLLLLTDGTYLIGGLGNGMPLACVNIEGDVLWRQTLTQENVFAARKVIVLDDGSFLIAGLVQIVNGRSYDAVLVKTDPQGKVGD